MRTSKPPDPGTGDTLERLKLMIYLVPVFGDLPSAVQPLAQNRASRKEQDISRLVVTLALTWVMIYGLLSAGSHLAPGLSLRFLVSNATGYHRLYPD